MPAPHVIDMGKSVISPMPGAVISVNIEEGQTIQFGQELLVIEAMKMQNIIKSEIEGKVKKVNCKPGQPIPVDYLLIELE